MRLIRSVASTSQLAVSPLKAVAVTVTVPGETAVTTPSASTVTTDGSDDFQVRVVSHCPMTNEVAVRRLVSLRAR